MTLKQEIHLKLPNRSHYPDHAMNYCSWMIQAENIGEKELAERLLDNLIILVEGGVIPIEEETPDFFDFFGISTPLMQIEKTGKEFNIAKKDLVPLILIMIICHFIVAVLIDRKR